MRPIVSRSLTVTALVLASALSATSASADADRLTDPLDPTPLDIAAISHRHASEDDVTYRVVFRQRVARRLLVRNLELYLEGRRGTTSPFESPSTLVYGRAMRVDDRIVLRLFFYDVEMVTHRLTDVPIRTRPRSAVMTIPTDVISTTRPFTYRWVARTAIRMPGGPSIEDQTEWLWHRIVPA
jgi:hypothetical protein